MATERWDDERLDRLAELVEANSRNIAANSRDIAANSRDIAANSRDIVSLKESIVETNRVVLTTNQNLNQLVDAMQEQQEANTRLFQVLVQEIRELHSEITGIRAENRRILTHLFGEQSE